MKIIIPGSLVFIFTLSSFSLFSQFSPVESMVTFRNKIDNPIDIEVTNEGNKFTFYANNRSFYPYMLELRIDDSQNLVPARYNGSFKVLPGKNLLVTLSKKNDELGSTYRYSMGFMIGILSENVDLTFPYLLPVRNAFGFVYNDIENNIIERDFFKISPGDSVYAMRRGQVVAVPEMFFGADRISKGPSLEVMHPDGTIMIYDNLDADNAIAKIGKTVYPGEVLGIIDDAGILETRLYMIMGMGSIRGIEINYCASETSTIKFSEKLKDGPYIFPVGIITREMSKREIKKFENGKL